VRTRPPFRATRLSAGSLDLAVGPAAQRDERRRPSLFDQRAACVSGTLTSTLPNAK
jgi:hypothetical protein